MILILDLLWESCELECLFVCIGKVFWDNGFGVVMELDGGIVYSDVGVG